MATNDELLAAMEAMSRKFDSLKEEVDELKRGRRSRSATRSTSRDTIGHGHRRRRRRHLAPSIGDATAHPLKLLAPGVRDTTTHPLGAVVPYWG